jgi:hypothetical protein
MTRHLTQADRDAARDIALPVNPDGTRARAAAGVPRLGVYQAYVALPFLAGPRRWIGPEFSHPARAAAFARLLNGEPEREEAAA